MKYLIYLILFHKNEYFLNLREIIFQFYNFCVHIKSVNLGNISILEVNYYTYIVRNNCYNILKKKKLFLNLRNNYYL